jgi:pimeloyl-ACP methyl ester carboxylesterase
VSSARGIEDRDARARRRVSDDSLAREVERDGVAVFLDRWLAQPLFASLPAEQAGVDERLAGNSVARLAHQLRALGQGSQPDNWRRLAELHMPVLLIAGGLDAKYAGIARRTADAIGGARVEIVDGAGHACHLENPAVVRHLLTTW